MKKFITAIAITLCSLTVQAQNAHLDFAGVPINGSLDSFVNALVEKGFEAEDPDEEDSRTLSGSFNGESVRVLAYCCPNSKTAYKLCFYLTVASEAEAKQKVESYVSLFQKNYPNNTLDKDDDGKVNIILSNGNFTVGYSKYDDTYSVFVDIYDHANYTLYKQEASGSSQQASGDADSSEESEEGGEEESEE